MKWLLRLCLFTAILGVASCGSNNTPTGPSGSGGSGSSAGTTQNGGTMQATIDGVAWTAASVSAKLETNGDLLITGVDSAATTSLGFDCSSPASLTNPVHAGATYQIPSSTSDAVLQTFVNGFPQATYTAGLGGGTGSITVTSLSSTGAAGTFAFTAKGPAGATKTVTNGSFNVTFSK